MRIQELGPVVALAHEAGNAVLTIYNRSDRNAVVDWKADRTPLTEGDRAGHEVIVAGLRALDPHTPIVSEEGDAPVGSGLASGAPHWMVDPLDGTKEFLKGTGEFTVNIALIGDGRPLAGVVHAPVLGQTWIGGVDGAERREGNRRERLRVRRIRPDRLGVVASRDHTGPRVVDLLERLPGAETVSMGSSLKFCLIAEGNADLYLRDGPTMEWDTAAAQAVLEAAGGGVFTLEGQRLSYGKLDFLNPHFLALGDVGWDWTQVIRGRSGS